MDHADFVAEDLVEGLFKAHVGIDFKVVARAQAHARRPLADVEAAVVAQVETAVERAGAGRFDQALGHAAAGAWCRA